MLRKGLFGLILYALVLPSLTHAQDINNEQKVNYCKKAIQHQEKESIYLEGANSVLKRLKLEKPSLDNYYKVREIWIDLTGFVYKVGSFDDEEFRKRPDSEATKADEACLAKLISEKKRLKTKTLKTFVLASQLRTREIAYQKSLHETSIFNWTNDFFKDLLLEIKVIPLRWVAIFTSKVDRFQTDIDAGVEGWLRVAKDLLLLLVFILSLASLVWFSLKFSFLVSKYREKILKYLYSDKKYYSIGQWVQKLFPYFPWILLIVFVRIEQELIKNTYFSDLSIFLPYVTYYGFYKAIRIFISQVFINFFSYAKGYELRLLKDKVERSVNTLSKFVIWSLVLLHTAESAVGRGFIYLWIDRIFFLGLFYLFISESRKWENEIEDMIKGVVPERFCTLLINFSNRLFIFRSIVLLVLSIFFYVSTLVYNWFQTLEIAKTLSARVFRERVRSAAKKSQESVSDKKTNEYESLFFSNGLIQKVESQENIILSIEDYFNKKNVEEVCRKNVGIIGETGLGKTLSLSLLEDRLKTKVNVQSFTIDSRNRSESFLELLDQEIKDTSKESVFLVDNLHNLFLAKVGGFQEIKQFFTLIDNSPDNISWVVVINRRTWNYLDSILNKTRYFASFYNIEKWSEEEIKELILSKHNKTGYSLSYNNILLAMKSENYFEDKKYVEEKFFRILWEESLGNPMVAQKLWVEALRPSLQSKNLNVGIPHSRFESIKGLPNEFYFVLASIVKHVEIDLKDLAKVNDVDMDFIRNAVEYCDDRGYIIKTKKSVKIAPLWQNNIITTLAGKNYIYGR